MSGGAIPDPDSQETPASAGAAEGQSANGLVVVRPALGSMLVDDGLVTSEQIETAMDEGAASGERLGEVLLRRGWVDEADLARTIARQWGLPYVPENEIVVDPRASLLISPEEAREAGVYPLCFNEQHRTVVAVADPTEGRLDHLRALLGGQVQFAVATVSALRRLQDSGVPGTDEAPLEEPAADEAPAEEPAEEPAADETPVVDLDVWSAEPPLASPEPTVADPGPAAAAHVPADPTSLLGRLDAGSEALAEARAEVVALLEAVRSLEERLATSERELEGAIRAREHEETRVAELEASLGQREDFLAGLRSKLSELDRAR